jgi:anti-sigma regulatory factor (Ser/Thr protein kinase)
VVAVGHGMSDVTMLESNLSAPGTARRLVAEACAGWQPGRANIALLLTSELVTNAVKHAPGLITLRVMQEPGRVCVEVGDSNPVPPRPIHPDPGAPDEGPIHGLHIVEGLADRWGSRPRRRGKVVWFCLTEETEPA